MPENRERIRSAPSPNLVVQPKRIEEKKRQRILQFLNWALSAGQKESAALGYIGLPDIVAESQRQRLQNSFRSDAVH